MQVLSSVPGASARSMRILHLQDRLSARGGADLHLLSILEHGLPGLQMCLAWGRADGSASLPAGVEGFQVPGLGARAQEGAAAVRRIVALLREVRPDVVHVHNVLQPEVLHGVAETGLPLVATIQDHRSFCPGRGKLLPDGAPCERPMSESVCRDCVQTSSREQSSEEATYSSWIVEQTQARIQALARCDRLVTLSRAMAAHLLREGMESSRIRVIPPFPWGLPALPRSESGARGYLLAAGRMVEVKGFQVLIEAWARTRDAPGLILAGDGSWRPRLEALALRVTPAPRAPPQFTGWLNHQELATLLAGSMAFVLPSLWDEPFGIAGLEAMSMGIPVLASRVGGVNEWLDARAGWLLDPGDVGALTGAIEEASQPEEARRRGDEARRLAGERFSPMAAMALLRELYSTLPGVL